MAFGRLHLITPSGVDAVVLAATAVALEAGAPVVQVRMKDTPDRARLATIAQIRSLCAPFEARCIVNDRCDLALAAGADGVHVGAEDVPVAVARRLVGPDAIVGGTCRNADDARRAEDEGATYLGVGPVYVSSTKSGLPEPIGAAGIARIAAAVSIPVIAISGVTVERVPELLDAGAHGVAVVAAVYDAPDPAEATRAFLDAVGTSTVSNPARVREVTR